MAEPRPGDFALTRIDGITGRAIALGQRLIGDGAPVQHAMLYVGDGMVVQAMPGGAECIPLSAANAPVVWSSDVIRLTDYERQVIASTGYSLIGTPYSFLDYASIGLATFHIRPAFVRRFVADSDHMICSQLVDFAYDMAGVHLFSDGRIPGDVTPGDLYRLLAP
jgi:uncharacterized protein YycO